MEDNFIEELKQEIKYENTMKMFNKYFPHVLVFCGIIIFFVALYVVYGNYMNKKYEKMTDKLSYIVYGSEEEARKSMSELNAKSGYIHTDFAHYYLMNKRKELLSDNNYKINDDMINGLICLSTWEKGCDKNYFSIFAKEKKLIDSIVASDMHSAHNNMKDIEKEVVIPQSMNQRIAKYKQYLDIIDGGK